MKRNTFLLLLSFVPLFLFSKTYDVTDYHIIPDGKHCNTHMIQTLIDRCSKEGGGNIVFPKGEYLTATIQLRDNITLVLEAGCVIYASSVFDDYPDHLSTYRGLIEANECENVKIIGKGMINASGDNTIFHNNKKEGRKGRLYALLLRKCKHVKVNDVFISNPSFWTFRIDDCDYVVVDNIKIKSVSYFNNDGIDIDGRHVVIKNSEIECIDDGICLKSYYKERPCENILVENCTISSNCNAIKLGTASEGGFKKIIIRNCEVKAPKQNDYFDYKKYLIPGITENYTNNSGIALELVDGGIMDDVYITDIKIQNSLTPIFIRHGERRNPPCGIMKNIKLNNIEAWGCSLMSSSITGQQANMPSDISLSNIIIHCSGGGLYEHTLLKVPEPSNSYPENKIFGYSLPAYGFYVRNIENIVFENISIILQDKDERHAFVFQNCKNAFMKNIKSEDHQTSILLIKADKYSNVDIDSLN